MGIVRQQSPRRDQPFAVAVAVGGSCSCGLVGDSDDAAIVSSTVGLSRQLGLSVIAEGIENRATADFLVSMGCEEGQGYFFGKPMPAYAFERQFLTEREAALQETAQVA
jgi:EAL domain-containing protein (putative c-di-GMP-specific phosphodiesterase class I)